MIYLIYTITFILCIAAAVMGVLLPNDLRKRYHEHGQTQLLFYQQAFVYLFAFYAIWGSILAPHILSSDWLTQGIREKLTVILVVLAIPFQLFSWWYLLRLFLEPLELKRPFIASTLIFAGIVISALLFTIVVLPNKDLLKAASVIFCCTHLMISMIVAALLFYRPGKLISRKTSLLASPLIVLIAIIQSAGTIFYNINALTTLLFILLFFLLNLWPVLLFWFYAEKPFNRVEEKYQGNETLLEKYQISKRESEIIRGICQGKTNQEIADDLFITLQTVKDHTSRIYLKTTVKNRTQLSNLFGSDSGV
jgi:DNA-binding CsgD family transcriptional regulator